MDAHIRTTDNADDLDLAIGRITHTVVMVGSDTARRWLDRNTRNRPISQVSVERYRRSMQQGLWAFAADPIRFDSDGVLIDGQHRLTAHSGIDGLTLPYLVVRGLPAESQQVMDQGAKRTAGDQLSLIGVKNGHFIASCIKQFLIHDSNLAFRDHKRVNSLVGSPEIERWVQDNPADVEFLQGISHLARQNDAPPSVAGAAALMFGRIDSQDATEFFRLLARGAGTEGHPITTLDKRLQRNRREGLRMSQRDYLALFIQSWNAWREGRLIKKFPRPAGGSWSAANYPEPR